MILFVIVALIAASIALLITHRAAAKYRHEWKEASRHREIYVAALFEIYQGTRNPKSVAEAAIRAVAYE
jgi:hypothetical protein